MYDKYMIVEKEAKNITKDGKIVGFQFGGRLPYYRGVVLSLVGDSEIKVDGELIDQKDITVELDGKDFKKTDFEDLPDDKWEFGDIGKMKIAKEGGLTPGEHTIEFRQHMKISYVPGGFWGGDKKVVKID